jgi:hypothetical protein
MAGPQLLIWQAKYKLMLCEASRKREKNVGGRALHIKTTCMDTTKLIEGMDFSHKDVFS